MDWQWTIKDDGLMRYSIMFLLCMVGYPAEFSWQCRCATWEYGSVYRYARSYIGCRWFDTCIGHHADAIKE